MSISIQERQQALDEFLRVWPKQRLELLTLSEYTSVGNQSTLVYWLEFGLGKYLGSIKGGDSSKFGIYERRAEPKGNRQFISSDDRYSWKNKYGTSANQAFSIIKQHILAVVNAAERGDLASIELLDFESALKWKLAFIYQNHASPCVLPIYKLSKFNSFMQGDPTFNHSLAYSRMVAKRGLNSALEFGVELWREADAQEGKTNTDFDNTAIYEEKSQFMQTNPLNQILFGPPGTGKTYETIRAALKILDPQAVENYDGFLASNASITEKANARTELKQRFDAFRDEERIRFVTFHQSFAYEDFVEGLRPVLNDKDQIEYRTEPGVFKLICDKANKSQLAPIAGIRDNARIWKISINGTGSSNTKSYCLKNGEMRIGWGNAGDLLQARNEYYEALGSGDKGTLGYFAEEIQVGDIVLCIRSADEVEAIGVVLSDYYHEAKPPTDVIQDYQQVRKVNWLYTGLKLPIAPLNENKGFTLKTVYPMDRFTWTELLSYLAKSELPHIAAESKAPEKAAPCVLIIDEINRGNISRIFGELITLIEPSKRAGNDEALEVILPYSKKPFKVPGNLYLIGTMNTADRSLSGLDLALRRRFTFVEMPPRHELLKGVRVEGVDIGELLQIINQRITVLLDRDHCIGHAYFMPLVQNPTLDELAEIFRQKILPLLQEYFFEDWERIRWVFNDHKKSQEVDSFLIQDKSLSLSDLFGDQINVPERPVWMVNEKAFSQPGAYRGIIKVQEKHSVAPAE